MKRKWEDVAEMIKARDLHDLLAKKEEKKSIHPLIWVLVVIGAITAVAAIAYCVYNYLALDYFDDFDDDFDDFDDDFFDDDDKAAKKDEAADDKDKK
jgi:hypothetical protein